MRLIVLTVIFVLLTCVDVKADELTDLYDLTQLESFSQENTSISFTDLLKQLISGDTDEFILSIRNIMYEVFYQEVDKNKDMVIKIIGIAIIGAIFTNISNSVGKGSVSETGFYVTYLFAMTLSLGSFYIAIDIGNQVLGKIVEFTKVLIPTIIMSVSMCSGSASGAGYYSALILVINIVNAVILKIIMPMITVYVIIGFVNLSLQDKKLSNVTKLIDTIINWSLKGLFALIMGINVIKGMILPHVDSVKETAFVKTIESIPGVGDTVSSHAAMLAGTASLIKNGIGTAALLVLIILVAIPVIKLAVIGFMHRIVSVLIEPISDSRLTKLEESVSNGAFLVLKCVITSTMLFLITIAIMCISTNVNFYSGA